MSHRGGTCYSQRHGAFRIEEDAKPSASAGCTCSRTNGRRWAPAPGAFVSRALRNWVRTWQAEGGAAVRDRVLDCWAERRERGRAAGGPPPSWPAPPVLNVLGVEAAVRLGGVPIQALARLRHEARRSMQRGAAVARARRAPPRLAARGARVDAAAPCPPHSRYSLAPDSEVARGGAGGAQAGRREGGPPREPRRAVVAVGGGARAGRPVRDSRLYDFGGFCRRAHLWEASGGFCDYSTDAERCRVCLEASGAYGPLDEAEHRALASAIAGRAAGLVFPSRFLRDRLAALLAWPDDRPVAIVEPGIDLPPSVPGLAAPCHRGGHPRRRRQHPQGRAAPGAPARDSSPRTTCRSPCMAATAIIISSPSVASIASGSAATTARDCCRRCWRDRARRSRSCCRASPRASRSRSRKRGRPASRWWRRGRAPSPSAWTREACIALGAVPNRSRRRCRRRLAAVAAGRRDTAGADGRRRRGADAGRLPALADYAVVARVDCRRLTSPTAGQRPRA